ncbi:MAG: hypothetical protein PVG66_08860 [Chromatiales bacterium]|jgi:hypothetical protein
MIMQTKTGNKSKTRIAVMLALGMLAPASVTAASHDEVTIRVIQLHEKTSDAVMNQILLPQVDKAQTTAAGSQTDTTIRQDRNPDAISHDLQDNAGFDAMEQDRFQEQQMEQEHNEIRNEIDTQGHGK